MEGEKAEAIARWQRTKGLPDAVVWKEGLKKDIVISCVRRCWEMKEGIWSVKAESTAQTLAEAQYHSKKRNTGLGNEGE